MTETQLKNKELKQRQKKLWQLLSSQRKITEQLQSYFPTDTDAINSSKSSEASILESIQHIQKSY